MPHDLNQLKSKIKSTKILTNCGKQEKHCATTIQLEGFSTHKSQTFTMNLL